MVKPRESHLMTSWLLCRFTSPMYALSNEPKRNPYRYTLTNAIINGFTWPCSYFRRLLWKINVQLEQPKKDPITLPKTQFQYILTFSLPNTHYSNRIIRKKRRENSIFRRHQLLRVISWSGKATNLSFETAENNANQAILLGIIHSPIEISTCTCLKLTETYGNLSWKRAVRIVEERTKSLPAGKWPKMAAGALLCRMTNQGQLAQFLKR